MSTAARRRTRLPVVIGVLLVIVAFIGVLVFGQLTTGKLTTKVRIVTAAHAIKTGDVVKSADLTTADFDVAPTGAIIDSNLAVGKIVRVDIAQGDPVLDSQLATPAIAGAAKLYFALPAGMVAINIPSSDISPYVQPGDEIDVIASPHATGGSQFKATLKGLKVLSVGTPGTPAAGNLVVAVNLEDAETLEFLVKNTDFTYVLKSPLDRGQQDPTTTGVDLPTFKARFGYR